MTLPLPSFPYPPEDYAPRDPPAGCDRVPRRGVELFRDFVLSNLGGGAGTITRPCDVGSASHHHEGRAWDWSVSADSAVDRAAVETLLSWLLAPDSAGNPHAMARRAGLDYIIWDAQIWNARDRVWTPYDGFDEAGLCASPPCRSAHRDHAHFSFGWPGANAETSFYEWLEGGPDDLLDVRPEPVPPPSSARPAALSGSAVLWGLAGLGAGYLAMRAAQRASMGVGRRRAARPS